MSAVPSPCSPSASVLDRVRIVMISTSHAGNIGSAARAMKTMGLTDLALVTPRDADALQHPQAIALASGATDVLERARIFFSLEDALADRHFALAFTARRRELAHAAKPLREAIVHVATEWLAESDKRVALVFGNETFGMSNEEADRCQMIATIPASPQYTSLNVAQAIQLATYEVMMAANAFGIDEAPVRPAADVAEVEGFLGHLESAAVASEFLDPAEPKRFMTRMRRLFARARMEPEEVAILRGLLAALIKGRVNRDR